MLNIPIRVVTEQYSKIVITRDLMVKAAQTFIDSHLELCYDSGPSLADMVNRIDLKPGLYIPVVAPHYCADEIRPLIVDALALQLLALPGVDERFHHTIHNTFLNCVITSRMPLVERDYLHTMKVNYLEFNPGMGSRLHFQFVWYRICSLVERWYVQSPTEASPLVLAFAEFLQRYLKENTV